MTLPWYENAIGHFLAGVTLSLADRAVSENATRHSERRMQDKLEEITALEYLVDNSDNLTIQHGREYAEAVINARSYFERQGISSESKQNENFVKCALRKTRNLVNHLYRGHERINNLPLGNKLVAAFMTEFTFDVIPTISQAIFAVGNGISALSRDLYQGPALFAGLQTGKGFLKMKDYIIRSKEEKELDSIGKDLTTDGKLLEIVRRYSPTRELRLKTVVATVENPKQLSQETTYSAADIGEKVAGAVGDTVGAIEESVSSGLSAIKERLTARKKARKDEEEARKAELRKKYDNY